MEKLGRKREDNEENSIDKMKKIIEHKEFEIFQVIGMKRDEGEKQRGNINANEEVEGFGGVCGTKK